MALGKQLNLIGERLLGVGFRLHPLGNMERKRGAQHLGRALKTGAEASIICTMRWLACLRFSVADCSSLLESSDESAAPHSANTTRKTKSVIALIFVAMDRSLNHCNGLRLDDIFDPWR